ncbi:MAG TPA: hypothetical protein VJU82_07700 [Acidobacteriaceae bacterium]|nr:hypothetical protein [Acidobacteriaceae bacterium]
MGRGDGERHRLRLHFGAGASEPPASRAAGCGIAISNWPECRRRHRRPGPGGDARLHHVRYQPQCHRQPERAEEQQREPDRDLVDPTVASSGPSPTRTAGPVSTGVCTEKVKAAVD